MAVVSDCTDVRSSFARAVSPDQRRGVMASESFCFSAMFEVVEMLLSDMVMTFVVGLEEGWLMVGVDRNERGS